MVRTSDILLFCQAQNHSWNTWGQFLNPDPIDVNNSDEEATKSLVNALNIKGNNDKTISDYLDAYKRFLKWENDTLSKDLTNAFEFKPAKKQQET